jgi:hypothetical protein
MVGQSVGAKAVWWVGTTVLTMATLAVVQTAEPMAGATAGRWVVGSVAALVVRWAAASADQWDLHSVVHLGALRAAPWAAQKDAPWVAPTGCLTADVSAAWTAVRWAADWDAWTAELKAAPKAQPTVGGRVVPWVLSSADHLAVHWADGWVAL